MNACDIISMLLAMSIVIFKCYASDCVSSKLHFILEEEETSKKKISFVGCITIQVQFSNVCIQKYEVVEKCGVRWVLHVQIHLVLHNPVRCGLHV